MGPGGVAACRGRPATAGGTGYFGGIGGWPPEWERNWPEVAQQPPAKPACRHRIYPVPASADGVAGASLSFRPQGEIREELAAPGPHPPSCTRTSPFGRDDRQRFLGASAAGAAGAARECVSDRPGEPMRLRVQPSPTLANSRVGCPSCEGWCERRDSNPHALRHWNLNPGRLPIPPLSRCAQLTAARCHPRKRKRPAEAGRSVEWWAVKDSNLGPMD